MYHKILSVRADEPRKSPDEMEQCRRDLATAKSGLDSVDHDAYHRGNFQLDPFRRYKFSIAERNGVPPEHMSNAWLKCYELLSTFDYDFGIRSRKGPYRVFCNAEFPGSFVLCIEYYFTRHAPNAQLEWIASSLVDDKSTALTDKYGLRERCPDKWLMCDEFNGDITDPATFDYLLSHVDKVDLYTSDFGMDVTDDPGAQETTHLCGNIGQMICGLATLNPRGSMIFKTFTCFEPFNCFALETLNALFARVEVCKPVTSRPGNSELYIVCVCYKGYDDSYVGIMRRLFSASKRGEQRRQLSALLPVTSNIDEIVKETTRAQIAHLQKSITAYSTKKKPNMSALLEQFDAAYPDLNR